MIKMTVATDTHGNVLGAIQHQNGSIASDAPQCGVTFARATDLHTIEVEAAMDMGKATDPVAYLAALERNVRSYRAKAN